MLPEVHAGAAEGGNPSDHVQAFGTAPHLGSLDTIRAGGQGVADAAVVALVPLSPSGYWIVTADGSVYSFGDAAFFGSLPGLAAAGLPIDPGVVVAAAVATPSAAGYWLVDEQGGVFTFGDASFLGSLPALRTAGVPIGSARIVAMGVTPSAAGYWLVDEQGGVFTFGDAEFAGSAATEHLAEPVVAFAATSTSGRPGYRLLTADGRVRSYGGAVDHGSAVVQPSESAMALTSSPGGGYWVVTPHDRPTAGVPPLPAGSGDGRRVVYSNSRQRVWIVEATSVVTGSWPVSGRRGIPSPGTYQVFSKSPASTAHGGALRLDHMVRFARGERLSIGFHAIPTAGGRPIQSLDELGQYRSAGCVRQAPSDAARLYAWAPLGTTVVVTP